MVESFAPVTVSNRETGAAFYYGWVIVVVAALAMVATMPGRTHGLGTVTERLLADPELNIDRVQFGELNFWATILGATFCLPCGKLLDRFGIRLALTFVTALLGTIVLAMTWVNNYWLFFLAILLTRGLGQSALSVVSLSMTGKWFSRRLGLATAVYTVLMAGGWIAAFSIIGIYREVSWRVVWAGMGYGLLLGLVPLGWLAVRNSPEECGLQLDGNGQANKVESEVAGYSLRAALAEPAFWAFALATSVYGLVSSGTSLFNEAILLERGFSKETYYTLLKISTGLSLAGNFLGGWLVQRTSLRQVMGISMSLLAAALLWLPQVCTFPQLLVYALGFSLGGGMMTVVFFTAFGKVFGRLHLGQIQGVAQMLTVFASALGPVLLAYTKRDLGSYMPFFYASAFIVLVLVFWACVLKLPVPRDANCSNRVTSDV